jgi:hypothetical protein
MEMQVETFSQLSQAMNLFLSNSAAHATIQKKGGIDMFRHPHAELEVPPFSHVICGAICSIIFFFSLPFLLWRISEGYYDNPAVLSWFDIGYHILILFAIFKLFREYLTDSLLNMQLNREKFAKTVAIAAACMMINALGWYLLYRYTGNDMLYVAAYGTAPLTELDVLVLSGDAVVVNPIFATACMVLVTPIINGCLYYAIGFSFFYNIRPWLGYLVVCLAVAFPRFCCGATWWNPDEQLMLYISQLPMHLICCWAYRKIDTVWASIGSLMVVNLAFALLMNFLP